MYECIKFNKTWEILLLSLKIPVILHSIEFEILTCTMLKIAFPGLQISKYLGGHAPDPPRGSCLRRSYLITPLNEYCCQYEHPSKTLSYGPDSATTTFSDHSDKIAKEKVTNKCGNNEK